MKVTMGGQLEVNKLILLDWTFWCLIRFFVSRSPYLALEYQSDVTKGVNFHLEVKIGGELEVKHLNLLY